MTHAYADLAFTPAVKALQAREGSRDAYARSFESPGAITHQRLGPRERAFIAAQRSFYIATVSQTGWPYVQHRGGPIGLLHVMDDTTLAFADFTGNRQFISAGNLAGDDRAALILVDYARSMRMKLLVHLEVRDLAAADPLRDLLLAEDYVARPQRAFVMRVAGFDWNCPQHIPRRFEADDVERALAERDARIAALEAQVAERT